LDATRQVPPSPRPCGRADPPAHRSSTTELAAGGRACENGCREGGLPDRRPTRPAREREGLRMTGPEPVIGECSTGCGQYTVGEPDEELVCDLCLNEGDET